MKVFAALICAALLAAAPAQPEAPQQNSVNPEIVQAFLSAYNASNERQLEDFARAHFSRQSLDEQPPAALARRYTARRQQTGALTYRQAGTQAPERSEFLAENPRHHWFRVLVETSPGTAGFSDLTIDPTIAPPNSALHPKTQSELVRAIDSYLRQLATSGEFSGTVLVAVAGKPVLGRATGNANIEHHEPNRMDTRFNIGSIGKVFTQVAVLQLMQAGTLHASDTIGRWLPDYPNTEAARSVTVAQLLSMRSGIGDFFGPAFMAAPHARIRTLEDYLPFFASKPLAFKPGTSEMYSNGGYVVLGLIVQKASGQSYYDYIRDRVFLPAGMHDCGYPAINDTAPGRATGYTLTPNGLQDATRGAPGRGSSAGGAYCTAGDLLKFAQTLRGNRFLNSAYTRWLLERFPDAGPDTGDTAQSGPQVLGIAGGTPGANALLLDDDRGNTIVVLANLDPPAAEALGRQIRRWSVEAIP